MTKVDWASVPRVDVITGGSPCQDLSHAGSRKGMKAGTRSGLWASMCDAIEIIRPSLVVWENVRGALNAEADSGMEPCPVCVGDAQQADFPPLRALGRVLGDLAELGYDSRVYGLRAADVGAPHNRFRIFVLAQDANGNREPIWSTKEVLDLRTRSTVRPHGPDRGDSDGAPTDAGGERHGGREDRGRLGRLGRLDGGYAGEAWEREWSREVTGDRDATDWRQYAPAIARWTSILGRPAPAPTEPGPKGNQRLSPRFVEWMQGLPDGWVTDPIIGISSDAMIHALGNGVVPQQAAAATAMWLRDIESEAVA